MLTDVVLFLAWTALEIVVVIASIRWGYETGQWKNLKDIEEPKYRMLIDREPEPWPGREKPPKPDSRAAPAAKP